MVVMIKYVSKAAGAALILSYMVGSASAADELFSGEIPGNFEGSITVGTDYIFRGISQTSEKPTLQAGVTWSHPTGLYAGFWGSNVDYADGDESSTEMDLFLGYSSNIGGLTYDFGFIQYFYPGTDSSMKYDFSEFMLGLSYDFDYFSAGASVNYSPEYWGGSGEAFYTAASFSVPLTHGISLDSGVGYQTMQNPAGYGLGNDYGEWHIGLTIPVKNVDINVKYTDTDFSQSECGEICDARVVASLSYNF
ncbi:MAG: hypothetical protein ACJARD_000280 [Alphaproteobacteria bacterium]|jgi:uncharacterized protein (TIGR02001 family)